jgi:hypothetical protein
MDLNHFDLKSNGTKKVLEQPLTPIQQLDEFVASTPTLSPLANLIDAFNQLTPPTGM